MRITRLNLDNFGPFNAYRVGALPPGLTVVHGPNEAGKSALRAFIRVVLFGFPTRSQKDAWNDYYYAPRLGGDASGSVHLAFADGSDYAVRRSEGPKGGPVAVTGAADGGAELLARLLAGIDAGLYQNVFSVSLTELQSLESLKSDEIRDRIYSAGLGLVNVSLPEVTKQLDERISVFRRTRSGRLFELEKAYRDAAVLLEDKRAELAGYEQLAAELNEITGRVSTMDAQITEVRRLRERNARLAELRPHWIRAGKMRARLEAIPERPGFPERGLERLDRLIEDRDRLREQIGKGEVAEESRRQEMAGLPVIEAFVEHEAEIARVVQQTGYYEEAFRDIPKRQAEEGEAARSIERALAELGPEWSEQRLREFKDAPGAASRLQEAGEAESSARREHEFAVAEAVRRKDELTDAEQAAARGNTRLDAQSDVPPESREALAARRDRLERLRAALAELGDLERLAANASGGRSPETTDGRRSVVIAAALGLAGLAAAGWGIAAGEISGTVAGGLAFAAAIALGIRSRRGYALVTARETAATAEAPEERAARVTREIESLRDELGLERPLSTRGVVEALSAAERAIERRAEYERLSADLQELDLAVRHASDAVVSSDEAVVVAAEAHAAAVTQWNEALSDLSLHASLDMPRALTAVGDISTRQAELRLLDETRRRITGMMLRNGETDRALAAILEAADLPGFEPGDGLAALRDLEGRWNEHRDALARRRTIEHTCQTWHTEHKTLTQRVADTEHTLDQLVSAGGCSGTEEFRNVAAALSERTQVDVELRQLYDAQPELAGPDGEEIADELNAMSPDDMAAREAELGDRLGRLEAERKEAFRRSGELGSQLRQLETEDAISQLHTTIDRMTEETRVAGRRWSVLTIARTLLDRTRAEFQESRQPALLGAASEHFRRMTLGRYTGVRAVLGENRFEVVTDDSLSWRPEQLSRGTVEQLFLALRFALVEEYCRNTEPMPVLLDDVLVNFDPVRASAAAAAIIDLSQRHQVIALTCHPGTVATFKEAAAAARIEPPHVVSLESGTPGTISEADPPGHGPRAVLAPDESTDRPQSQSHSPSATSSDAPETTRPQTPRLL